MKKSRLQVWTGNSTKPDLDCELSVNALLGAVKDYINNWSLSSLIILIEPIKKEQDDPNKS